MADRYRDDDNRYRSGYGRSDNDRTVEGSGYGGRNWAERTTDEVASWVGDDDAEQRRERDRQTMGRYPGEDRGERNYSAGYTSSTQGRSDYGRSGYGQERDLSSGYRGYEGRSYGSGSSDRTVEGSGYQGRNWAERTGDEVASWVGDSDAEQRREKDRQTMGRYPGENRGERNFGASGRDSYGAGTYGAGTSGGRPYSGGGYSAGNYGLGRDDNSQHYSRASGYSSGGSNFDGNRSRSNEPGNYGGSDEDRGFFSRAADEVRSWFGDDNAEDRRERDTMSGDARDSYAGAGARTGGSSGTGFSAATGTSTSNYANDPHYSAYRSARMAEYDRDYHEYSQHKSGEFEKDFSTWRSTRQQSGSDSGMSAAATAGMAAAGLAAGAALGAATGGSDMASKIKEHARVVGSDGQSVGEVDRVTGSDIKLAKKDQPDQKHHLIPVSWVASVDGDTVKLTKTAADAKREWRDGDSAAPGSATPTAA